MEWLPAIVIVHIFGTVLGVGGATFAEINLVRTIRDGVISPNESEIMKGAYAVLRLGFFLLVLSGFSFLLYYRLIDKTEYLYLPEFWAKLTIIGVIALNAILLQAQKINLLWGSAISLTSWYGAITLGVLHKMELNYFTTILIYIISIMVVYIVIRAVHNKYCRPREINIKTS